VESPSLEIFQPRLAAVLCSLLWVTLLGQGVGVGDPQRSLPTLPCWDSVWFCPAAGLWRRVAAAGCAGPRPTAAALQSPWKPSVLISGKQFVLEIAITITLV